MKSEKKSRDLFKNYVNIWLKIKQEASRWPEHVGNAEAKRQQYLRDYYEREGIQLEYHKIHYNPGLRALAKMKLNSFWGKFDSALTKHKDVSSVIQSSFTDTRKQMRMRCNKCPFSASTL